MAVNDDPDGQLGQIEAWLHELAWLRQVGATVRRSDDDQLVVVDSQQGEVIISVEEESAETALLLGLGTLELKRRHGDLLADLLRQNSATGAKFAFSGEPGEREWLFGVLARTDRHALRKHSLEWNLKSVIGLAASVRGDEAQAEELGRHVDSGADVAGQLSEIEAWLHEMGEPVGREWDGQVVVHTEQGDVFIWIDPEGAQVGFALSLGTVKNKPKRDWPFYAELLRICSATGAKVHSRRRVRRQGVGPRRPRPHDSPQA